MDDSLRKEIKNIGGCYSYSKMRFLDSFSRKYRKMISWHLKEVMCTAVTFREKIILLEDITKTMHR